METRVKITFAAGVQTNNKFQIIIMGHGDSLSYFILSWYFLLLLVSVRVFALFSINAFLSVSMLALQNFTLCHIIKLVWLFFVVGNDSFLFVCVCVFFLFVCLFFVNFVWFFFDTVYMTCMCRLMWSQIRNYVVWQTIGSIHFALCTAYVNMKAKPKRCGRSTLKTEFWVVGESLLFHG